MARADKVGTVTELTERLRGSSASLLTEYRGLTVSQMTQLRRSLGSETTYEVVKNTLTRRAAKDAELELDDSLFTGPTAIAFVGGDPVEAAKGVRDFAKANPALVIKGGVMDGRFMTVEEVTQLADLESREVLLARLAGGMKASLTQAAALFQAPLTQAARLMAALQEKLPAEPVSTTAAPENSAGTDESSTASPADSAETAESTTAESTTAESTTEESATAENTTGEDGSDSAEPAV